MLIYALKANQKLNDMYPSKIERDVNLLVQICPLKGIRISYY